MFKRLKKLFYNQSKETIRIFEENTKIDYDPTIFSSLKILSLTHSQLNHLEPLSVFVNLEMLNLSNNKIEDINSLQDLKKLKIIDLRFNNIERIPLWVFDLELTIYWERIDEEKEGIYFEGNPLDSKLITQIKNYPFEENIEDLVIEKKENKQENKQQPIPIEVEKLTVLNRQRITIFKPQLFLSDFTNSFNTSNNISTPDNKLKLNIFTVEYDNNHKILNQEPFQKLKYIILILKNTECCINPPILELLSNLYSKSKIFLIIENSDSSDIKKKMIFFRTYTKAGNIIDVYHSFDKKSNELIKDKIYNYLENTQEANSLWRKNWIELRDEIEANKNAPITHKEFQTLADKYALASEERDDIFAYLKRVGSIE